MLRIRTNDQTVRVPSDFINRPIRNHIVSPCVDFFYYVLYIYVKGIVYEGGAYVGGGCHVVVSDCLQSLERAVGKPSSSASAPIAICRRSQSRCRVVSVRILRSFRGTRFCPL